MTFHLEEGLDLADSEVLAVTEGHQLVEGAKQFVGISEDFALVEAPAGAGDNLGEKVEGVDVLKNVGLLVGDEDHVQLIQGLVDESDIVLLDDGVLGARVGGLGERGEEGFDTGALDIVEGAG